jgi:phosphate transport system substrate-binding protein
MSLASFVRIAAISALMLGACGKSELSQMDTAGAANPAAAGAVSAEKLKIVGSSTVAPFSTTVAERFGATSGFQTPIVETTGTGGGFTAFCQGLGPDQPSITNASRAIKSSEKDLCAQNGVTEITEMQIGFDGVVIANAKAGPTFDFTKKQIFLALAKELPDGKGGFVANTAKTWKDVGASLPDEPIMVFGPPPTSGTRDAFVELAMEKGAEEIPELAALKASDAAAFKDRSHTVRTDGAWIDSGENDTAIIQSLTKTPGAIGVLGFSFLDQNGDRVKGAKLAGAEASFDNITSGVYGLSRVMYFYVKDQNLPMVGGLSEYVAEFATEGAIGPEGYLIEKGLIPLSDADREAQRVIAAGLKAKVTPAP